MKPFVLSFFLLLIFTATSTRETVWVALGDSITYLNDHRDETGDRITKGYLTAVTEKLPEISVVNKGFNGWTAVQIANKFSSLNIGHADVYTVFLGTNDWWHGNPIGTLNDYKNDMGNKTFFGAYRTITRRLKEINPNARIILITPMQRSDFVYIADMKNNAFGSYKPKAGQLLKQFADAVSAVGKYEKFEVVDLFNAPELSIERLMKFKRLKDPKTGKYKNYTYPEFIDVPFNPATDEYPYPLEAIDMTYDGLHPSDKGYEIITRMLVDLLKKDR
ncbi:MAG TPA: SGNH/GDSL hydrolase family protein [Chryseolinea sp.]